MPRHARRRHAPVGRGGPGRRRLIIRAHPRHHLRRTARTWRRRRWHDSGWTRLPAHVLSDGAPRRRCHSVHARNRRARHRRRHQRSRCHLRLEQVETGRLARDRGRGGFGFGRFWGWALAEFGHQRHVFFVDFGLVALGWGAALAGSLLATVAGDVAGGAAARTDDVVGDVGLVWTLQNLTEGHVKGIPTTLLLGFGLPIRFP